MSIDVPTRDRIPMSQKERDVLKIMHAVLSGERTQAEAGRLLDLSVRQVRRLQRKLEAGGDAAIIHGLRGRASNHQAKSVLKERPTDADAFTNIEAVIGSEQFVYVDGCSTG